jgi:hypothetical protein
LRSGKGSLSEGLSNEGFAEQLTGCAVSLIEADFNHETPNHQALALPDADPSATDEGTAVCEVPEV